jgi:DNA (cytosine-5)-methyltransferase 1
METTSTNRRNGLKVASLFSGIGGVELGLQASGFSTEILCEIDEAARTVLKSRFPNVPIHSDVRTLSKLPKVDLLAAGFPCQDLSQAGRKVGITGNNSGLVQHVFRLIAKPKSARPKWVLLENVTYMLRLDRGQAMRHIISAFEQLGYRWAYRVVDIRSFGLPQRRQRVVFLASNSYDPREVLFADDQGIPEVEPRPALTDERSCYGFYWTEGSRGVGWALEATPPIKGGSTIGIPSPPAVWRPRHDFVGTIHIDDAERLQGFEAGWTMPVLESGHTRPVSIRWRMVGNAVCVPMAEWVGQRLMSPQPFLLKAEAFTTGALPIAAWGERGKIYTVNASKWPLRRNRPKLSAFLQHDLKPLSERATLGFLSRAKTCTNVVYSERFLGSLATHAASMKSATIKQ